MQDEHQVKSTLDQMSKTGGSMRDVKKTAVHGIKIGQRPGAHDEVATSHEGRHFLDNERSAAEFAASATSRSLVSNQTAEVVSKGGIIPD